MRKVKVLALLLAALMVVAVFAGCADTDAIVADVENLDERVEALENLLNNQKDAIDDVKDQLGDVSDKLDNDTTAAQLEAVLKALEEQQKANAALQEQLKELGDKVTEVEKDTENADDDAALEAAVKVYTAQLQELKIACELKKDLYILADYEAVVKALSDGIVAVAAAEKADDAKAAFEAAKAVYDAKAIVSSKLAAFYAQVNNAITVDSKALIDEIRAYIYDDTTKTPVAKCPVTVKYGKDANGNVVDPATLTNSELLVANIYGEKNADGTAKLVNVVAELQKAVAAYDYIANANKANTFANKVKAAIDEIAKIKTVTFGEDIKAAKDAYAAVVADIVALDADKNGVTDNKRYAPFLADSIMAQVTNSAELEAAIVRLSELAVADAMYGAYATLVNGSVGKIFDEYKTILTKKTEVLYTNKAVYDAVDALLNKWVDAYKLEAENVELIVNKNEGEDFYYNYTLNKLETELSAKAYTDFAAIANRIAALNKLTTVNAANVNEYTAIAEALEAWVVLQVKSEDENATRLEQKDIVLDPANVKAIYVAYELIEKEDEVPANVYGLYDFANDDVDTFFATKYATIAAEAKALNTKISNLAKNIDSASIKYSTIEEYLKVAGEYADEKVVDGEKVKDGVWEKITPSGTTTIAGFLETYKAYDLASLIETAKFEAALAKQIARIDAFKTSAANVKALVDAVDYTAVIKTVATDNKITYTVPTKAQIEARDYYCYVNLSDADAVAKANNAYAAWIQSGANTKMAEWIPAVNEDGEVIEDTFVFALIADEITLKQLTQMTKDINLLKDAAAKIVAHFNLVAEVWAQNKGQAINATAEKNTDKTDVLTLVDAYLDAGVINKVSYAYPVVLPTADNAPAAYSFAFNNETIVLAYKGGMVETKDLAVTNLQAVVEAGYKAYQAFLTMNANLTFKTNSNGKVVLDKFAKVEDSAVKAAIDGIADLELVMLKDHAKDTIMDNTKLDASEKNTFCGFVDSMVTDIAGNGSKLHNIALELSAKFGVDMAALERGAAIVVTVLDEVNDGSNTTTNKPLSKNVQDYTQVFRVSTNDYGNLDK